MTPEQTWLLLDVGNTAIKWRLTHADCLLTPGGAVTDNDALLPVVVEDQPWSAVGISSVLGSRHIRQWLRCLVSGKQRP